LRGIAAAPAVHLLDGKPTVFPSALSVSGKPGFGNVPGKVEISAGPLA